MATAGASCQRIVQHDTILLVVKLGSARKFVIQFAAHGTVSYTVNISTRLDSRCHQLFSYVHTWQTVRGGKTGVEKRR